MTRTIWPVAIMVLAVTLSGCPVPQRQDTPVTERIETDPVSGQKFYLYVPSTYTGDQPAPLIVSCHGTPPYDIAEMHIREWKMLGEEHGCIVVAPVLHGTDGLLGDGPLVSMQADERIILSIISLLGYRYNIDRANIMLTGFSGGGFPTYWVGLRNPDVFSVVVARNCNFSRSNVEGWFAPGAASMPVKVYYGENDPGVIKSQSRQAAQFLRGKGFDVAEEVLQGAGHERRPEVAMRFFRDHWNPPEASLPPTRSGDRLAAGAAAAAAAAAGQVDNARSVPVTRPATEQ